MSFHASSLAVSAWKASFFMDGRGVPSVTKLWDTERLFLHIILIFPLIYTERDECPDCEI